MNTNKTVAAEIRQAAIQWAESGRKSFKGEADMLDAYRKDAADLKALAKLVSEGSLLAARNHASHLDTIVRDEIPESFFKLLEDSNIEW